MMTVHTRCLRARPSGALVALGGAALLLAAASPLAAAAPDGQPACPAVFDAAQAVAQINALRAQARACGGPQLPAAAALAWSPRLAESARQLAQDMADLDRVAHQDREGRSLGDRLQRQGYRYLAAAENIAGGQRSVPAVLDAWLASPTHCAALMSPAMNEVGLACVGRADSTYRSHWVMHLATPLWPAEPASGR